MIYTKDTKRAMALCFEAHKEQKDKSGMPYVFHPFHLAEEMETEDETVAALLHDVAEDTDITLEEIGEMGFSEAVMEALRLLTHEPGTPYMEYVRKIKENPVARAVKQADLKHNSDLTRLDNVDEKALKRVEKYKEALKILEE